MSPEVSIVISESWHVGEIKKNIRTADANEILRFGVSVQHGIWVSYRHAMMRRTALINGVPVAIWGCHGTMLGSVGSPYLITTPGVHQISPLSFIKIYQEQVYAMLNVFPTLVNYVDSEYDAAIRLLEIIGFTVDDPEPKGFRGAMYRRFAIERAK